jgi:hypothetical protein
VYYYYAAWRDEGIFKQLNTDLTALARQQAGRKAEPTAAIIDTQSIKTSTDVPTKAQGIDANNYPGCRVMRGCVDWGWLKVA